MALKTVIIPPEAEGMKTGLFLRRLFPDLPESAVRKLFDARDVRLDGVRVRKDEPVRAGQELRVFLPDGDGNAASLRIVYEDDDVLLVNKPAGVSVESDVQGAVSLSELCRLHVQAASPSAVPPSPCHRLDNKTSGLCLFAKNEHALAVLEEAFRDRTVEKYYVCLVRGIPKPPEAVCRAFLLKDAEKGKVRILDREVPGARPVITGYETLESGPVSRLRVHLITGRTHQIRAHLAALGHPILGDPKYGDPAFNRKYGQITQCLAACRLEFPEDCALPALSGRVFEMEAPKEWPLGTAGD